MNLHSLPCEEYKLLKSYAMLLKYAAIVQSMSSGVLGKASPNFIGKKKINDKTPFLISQHAGAKSR